MAKKEVREVINTMILRKHRGISIKVNKPIFPKGSFSTQKGRFLFPVFLLHISPRSNPQLNQRIIEYSERKHLHAR